MVIVVNEPAGGPASGGKVAAPVFARVAEHSLRMLGAAPDNLPQDGIDADSALQVLARN